MTVTADARNAAEAYESAEAALRESPENRDAVFAMVRARARVRTLIRSGSDSLAIANYLYWRCGVPVADLGEDFRPFALDMEVECIHCRSPLMVRVASRDELAQAREQTACCKPVTPARLDELRAMPYADYLLTPEWAARRAKALRYWEESCQRCRSTDGVTVIHRSFEHLGCERMDDLAVLCEGCRELAENEEPAGDQALSRGGSDER